MKKEIKFPIIDDTQVVLLRSEYNTGHVLDSDFILHTTELQEMYTIFESLEAAKIYISKERENRIGVEFTVFDKNNNVIYSSVKKL